MMMTGIEVNGVEKTVKSLKALEKSWPSMGSDISNGVAKWIQKSIKMRMQHVYFTGQMRESIVANNAVVNGNIITATITSDSPYILSQEYGFGPHFVHGDTPTGSGRIFADWIREKYSLRTGQIPSGLVVKKPINPSGYFIGPGVRAAEARIDKIAGDIVDKHIEKTSRQ